MSHHGVSGRKTYLPAPEPSSARRRLAARKLMIADLYPSLGFHRELIWMAKKNANQHLERRDVLARGHTSRHMRSLKLVNSRIENKKRSKEYTKTTCDLSIHERTYIHTWHTIRRNGASLPKPPIKLVSPSVLRSLPSLVRCPSRQRTRP